VFEAARRRKSFQELVQTIIPTGKLYRRAFSASITQLADRLAL
jgi:hypothetical protein